MATTEVNTVSKSGLLFLLLSVALAATVHFGLTSPSRELLEERRERRLELENLHAADSADLDALLMRLLAIDQDPLAFERELRRQDYQQKGEVRVSVPKGR